MTVLEVGTTGAGLLERDDALAVLGEALSEARLGRGSAVLVAGEAGAGKTALSRSFCRHVTGRVRVLMGACDPLSTPRPLGPLHDLAGSSRRLADLLEFDAPLGDVFGALWAELGEVPTVLVLEDLHWADEATLDILRMLVRRIETSPTVLVATYRDGEIPRGHPMRVLLGDLATSPAITRVDLQPLSRPAVASLAAGHDIDVDLLFHRTGGNPFFVTQVLNGDGSDVPPSVRDLVLARAAVLPPDAAALLDAVALTPPVSAPWMLESLFGEVTTSIEQCLATGLVSADLTGVRFRHELARLAVDEAVSPARRAGWHRRILSALEARAPFGDVDAALLAHHAEAAGDGEAVLRYAPEAGRLAARSSSYREAAAQFGRALRFAGGLSDRERADLLEGRSRACYLADDQLQAIAVIREAIECRRRDGDRLREARALTELVGYLDCRGFVCEATEAMIRARELAAGAPAGPELGFVLEMQARRELVRDPDLAYELATEAAEIGDRFGIPYVAGNARITKGKILAQRDFEQGMAELQSMVQWAMDRGLSEVAARGWSGLGGRAAAARRLDIADRDLDLAIEYCTEHTEDLWLINAYAIAARVSLDRGDWAAAVDDVAALLGDPRESPWPAHEANVVLSLVRARRGDPGAHEGLDTAGALGVPPDEVSAHFDRAVARAELAWIERHFDEVDRVTVDALADGLVESPDDIVRFAFWRRLAGLDVDLPDAVSGAYAAGARGDWTAAAQEFERWGMPYEAALARMEVGDEISLRVAFDEFQRLGATPCSKLAALRLRALGVRGLERGPRPTTKVNPAGLTSREQEVVQLLADGLRNADVAERLVISRRTVDHHVAAIMRKLGTRTRGEAVARAAQLGLTTA